MKTQSIKLKLDTPLQSAEYLVIEIGGELETPTYMSVWLHRATPKHTSAVRRGETGLRKMLWYQAPETLPEWLSVKEYGHLLTPPFDLAEIHDGRAWDVCYLTSILPTIRADFEKVYPVEIAEAVSDV